MTISELSLASRAVSKKRLLLLAGLLAVGIALRDHLLAALLFSAVSLWEVAPVVLVGVLVTAVLTATGSIGLLVATFGERELSAIVLVSLIGAVLPVCGITLLPLVAGLLAAGVALAPIMAFLLSSAVTDPAMFSVTAATIGLPFAIGKTVAAFGIGLLGGGVTWTLVRLGNLERPMRQSSMLESLMGRAGCSGPSEVRWQFWRERERVAAFRRTCWGMAKLVGLFLGAAFIAEYFLKLYVPEDSLAGIVGHDNAFSIPIATVIATPLYLDGYAALPLVRGLIDRGMAEGAAMAFLVAGGITSAWTALPVLALVRLPVFVTYIVLAVVGSMLSGWGYAAAIG